MNWTGIVVIAAIVVGFLALRRASFIAPERAQELLRQGALLVDVRNPEEFAAGHLSGALNIPLGGLAEQAPRSLPDKQKPLLLHCLSGTRSGMARRQLSNMGYTQVFNLGSYGRAGRIVSGK